MSKSCPKCGGRMDAGLHARGQGRTPPGVDRCGSRARREKSVWYGHQDPRHAAAHRSRPGAAAAAATSKATRPGMTDLTVNGRPVRFDMDPQTPLLWALRDAANLTGTKYGCGVGDCGACMVLVDGAALRSCLVTLAEAEGRLVTTIEGLSRDRSHPVQQALVAEQAIQCGFCTPGHRHRRRRAAGAQRRSERGRDQGRRSPTCAAAGSIRGWSARSSAPAASRAAPSGSAPRRRRASTPRTPRAAVPAMRATEERR